MKKLFFLFICIEILYAKYNFTDLENKVNNAEISVKKLDKKNIKKVNLKKIKLIELKERLEQVRKKIEKQNTLSNLKLNTFEIKIKAAYDTQDRNKDINSSFRQGDILEFSSKIQYPKLEEKITTTLQWQLFDEKGTPIKNYFKETKSQIINTSKTHKFKIRLGQNLKSGKYRVALTHFLGQNDKISQQSIKSFELNQDIEITNLKLFISPKDIKDRTQFYNNETPHMYVNFRLSPKIKKVSVAFTAINQDGKLLYEYKGERKRKSDSQRAGIKISDLKAGDTITFNAFITGDDGYVISRSKSFKVVYYPMRIVGDLYDITYNGKRNFKIKVPNEFEKPYTIINITKSKVSSPIINNDTLEGTLLAMNYSKYLESDNIKIMVRDSKGREAVKMKTITIKGKPEEKKIAKNSYINKTPKSINTYKPSPSFTFDTKKKEPKKYSKNKTNQAQLIKLGEKRFSALINNFNKVIPNCYQDMDVSAEVRKIPNKGKEKFGSLTSSSSIKTFEKEALDALVMLNIKHNILPNYYKNDQCAIDFLNRLKRAYPYAKISPYSYSQLSKNMISKKKIKTNNRASKDIQKCKDAFIKYKGFLKKGGYYGLGGSFALSNDGRFCGMSQVAYSSQNRMKDSMKVALAACNYRRKEAGVSGSCSIIHKTIKANIR